MLLVEEIAVKAEYRRQGLAIALFQKLIGFAKHQDMKQIYETINLDNDASIKFTLEIMSQRKGLESRYSEFEVARATPMIYVMEIALEDPPVTVTGNRRLPGLLRMTRMGMRR